MIVGMEAAATPELAEILVRFGAPVLSTYQAAGLVDTDGPLGAGLFTNGVLERPVLDAADLIITVGLDLVEPIPAPWTQAAPVVRLSSVIQLDDYLPATIDVVGPLAETARTVLQPNHSWADGEATALCSQARDCIRHAESSDTFGPVQLVETAIAALPDTITTTVDAGAHFLAVMPLWPVSEPFRLLISNGLATMAFAVPAAIGAAIARPGEPVLAFTGDGGMSMTMAELETIARLQLPITVVVFNDATLSLIRIKQTPEHGGDRAVAYRAHRLRRGSPGFRYRRICGELCLGVANRVGPRLGSSSADRCPHRPVELSSATRRDSRLTHIYIRAGSPAPKREKGKLCPFQLPSSWMFPRASNPTSSRWAHTSRSPASAISIPRTNNSWISRWRVSWR